METSYLKAHPFWNRYPEWIPNLHPDRGEHSNLLYFKRLYLNQHKIFKVILRLYRQNDTISPLLTRQTLLETPLNISVTLENSRGKRARCF